MVSIVLNIYPPYYDCSNGVLLPILFIKLCPAVHLVFPIALVVSSSLHKWVETVGVKVVVNNARVANCICILINQAAIPLCKSCHPYTPSGRWDTHNMKPTSAQGQWHRGISIRADSCPPPSGPRQGALPSIGDNCACIIRVMVVAVKVPRL